jgi:hypothetical protein
VMFGGQIGTGPGFPPSNSAVIILPEMLNNLFHSSSVDDIEY